MSPEETVKQIAWAMSKIEKAFDTPAHRWLKQATKKLEKLQPEPVETTEFMMKVVAAEVSASIGHDLTGDKKPSCSTAPMDTQERKTA